MFTRANQIETRLKTSAPKNKRKKVTVTKKNRRSYRIKELRRDRSSRRSGLRSCSYMCCFPGCFNKNNDFGIAWHKVPRIPIPPKTQSFIQIKNRHKKKKRRFIILDRLGMKAKFMSNPRWCSDHESPSEFT